MTRLFVRAWRAAISAGLLAAFAFAAGGCAWFEEPQSSYSRHYKHSSIKDAPAPVATARPKVKVAVPRRMESPVAVPKAPPSPRPSSRPPLLDQEMACISVDQCASVLKAMVDDPGRSWMSWPANATTLANGVRLFAYRSLRPKLSCSELTTAVHELTIAMAAFSGPVAGLQKEQIDRARALTASVEGELKTERANRCGNATGQALDIRQGALPSADSEGRSAAAGHPVR